MFPVRYKSDNNERSLEDRDKIAQDRDLLITVESRDSSHFII